MGKKDKGELLKGVVSTDAKPKGGVVTEDNFYASAEALRDYFRKCTYDKNDSGKHLARSMALLTSMETEYSIYHEKEHQK
jgi:hypothetical protein